jgi:hypothetical protein
MGPSQRLVLACVILGFTIIFCAGLMQWGHHGRDPDRRSHQRLMDEINRHKEE